MIVALPAPNAFPVGSHVRVDHYRGEVIELRGPYSVVLRQPNGQHLVTTTTDLEHDPDAVSTSRPETTPKPDLFSLL